MAFDAATITDAVAIWEQLDRLTRALERLAGPRGGSGAGTGGDEGGIPRANLILGVLRVATAAAEHPVAAAGVVAGLVGFGLLGAGLTLREVVR